MSQSRTIAVACAVAAATATLVGTGSAHAATAALYPKHIKSTVREASLFTSSTGNDVYTTKPGGWNFDVDMEQNGRYRIPRAFIGEYPLWITSDPRYVAPGYY